MGYSSSNAFSLANQTFQYYGGYTVFGGPATAYVNSVNDSGTIVGTASYSVFRAGLTIRPDGSSALLQTLPFAGFRPDILWGLNGIDNAGDIVGTWTYFDPATGNTTGEGFLLPASGAAATQLAHP